MVKIVILLLSFFFMGCQQKENETKNATVKNTSEFHIAVENVDKIFIRYGRLSYRPNNPKDGDIIKEITNKQKIGKVKSSLKFTSDISSSTESLK